MLHRTTCGLFLSLDGTSCHRLPVPWKYDGISYIRACALQHTTYGPFLSPDGAIGANRGPAHTVPYGPMETMSERSLDPPTGAKKEAWRCSTVPIETLFCAVVIGGRYGWEFIGHLKVV